MAKLRADGSALLFSSFVGGANVDNVRALAIDASGRIAVCGDTNSPDFPVAQALQPALGGGYDAWVGRVDAKGLALAPATYLGGSGDDFALGCDATPAGEIVVAGSTASANLPLANPAQSVPGGQLDAYVTKLDAGMATRVYSTYLGGSGTDFGLDVALDPLGGAVVVGSTNSTNYPVQAAIQAANGGSFDSFATKIQASGALEWSTYLGGSSDELAFDRMGVAIDPSGRPLLTGITRSANHPLAVPVQAVYARRRRRLRGAHRCRARSAHLAGGRSRGHATAPRARERLVRHAAGRVEDLHRPARRRDGGSDARAARDRSRVPELHARSSTPCCPPRSRSPAPVWARAC